MSRTAIRTHLSLAAAAVAALALSACGQKQDAAPAVAAADGASAQACGKVTVANMNWHSAEVLARACVEACRGEG